MAEAGYSGLYVKLTFPVPIVATAIYGGYGAVDVTPKTPTYAYRGSKELVLRLCSGGNNYNGVCPRYIVTEGAQAAKLANLEVHGERRGPLEDSEDPSSIMAVSVECESNVEHFERTVGPVAAAAGGAGGAATAHALPPSPQEGAKKRHRASPPPASASLTYDDDGRARDSKRSDGRYYDDYHDEDEDGREDADNMDGGRQRQQQPGEDSEEAAAEWPPRAGSFGAGPVRLRPAGSSGGGSGGAQAAGAYGPSSR